MELLIYFAISIFFIWWGFIEIKAGIKSIKKRERAIGPVDPKMLFPIGIMLIVAGTLILIKLALIPLYNEYFAS